MLHKVVKVGLGEPLKDSCYISLNVSVRQRYHISHHSCHMLGTAVSHIFHVFRLTDVLKDVFVGSPFHFHQRRFVLVGLFVDIHLVHIRFCGGKVDVGGLFRQLEGLEQVLPFKLHVLFWPKAVVHLVGVVIHVEHWQLHLAGRFNKPRLDNACFNGRCQFVWYHLFVSVFHLFVHVVSFFLGVLQYVGNHFSLRRGRNIARTYNLQWFWRGIDCPECHLRGVDGFLFFCWFRFFVEQRCLSSLWQLHRSLFRHGCVFSTIIQTGETRVVESFHHIVECLLEFQ